MTKDQNGIVFVAATIAWTWGILAVPAFLKLGFGNGITTVAYVLAGTSPSVFALAFVCLGTDKEYSRSFIHRIVNLNAMKVKDILVLILLIPAVTSVSGLIEILFTPEQSDWSVLLQYAESPFRLITFALVTLVFGPLAEEIGWRGYLLDKWKEKGLLTYGVGIGLIWAIWHLPMFFIFGTYQNTLLHQGFAPVFSFGLSTVALGVILGEFAKKSGSILPAILLHFMVNFTGELLPLDPMANLTKSIVLGIIACGMLYVYYRRRFAE